MNVGTSTPMKIWGLPKLIIAGYRADSPILMDDQTSPVRPSQEYTCNR